MYRRPLSVTFVGSILCILGVLGSLDAIWLISRISHPTIFAVEHFGILGGNAVITSVCGVFVLKGLNWARWLYPICFSCMAVYLEITNPGTSFHIVPTLIVQAALVLLLFLPRANEYFAANARVRC